MIEKIHQKLSDSKVARWSVLALAAFTMLCGYFLTDVMAPLKPMLEEQLSWTSTEYGWFTSAYGWFNVFLFMLIIGGIVLDKMGVRFTGVASCILMIIGCSIKYYAISDAFTMEGELFGWKAQVMVAALGYAIFGVGVETAGITVSKIIVRWFKGKEMALAMGLEMATARLGTALALSITVPAAKYFGSISAPILLCLCMLCIGLIAFLVFCVMDRKLDASMDAIEQAEEEEPFRLKDILLIVTNKGFWLIALLCVLFYSAVFPFLKYATDLMVNKYNVDPELAGNIPAILPFGTILLTPFFGNLYDRKGKGATIMIYGALMLIGVHLSDLESVVVRDNRDDRIGYRFPLGSIGDVAICSEDYPGEAIRHGLCLDFLGTEYRSEYGSLINRLDIGYVLQNRQWYGQTGLRLYDTDGSLHLLRCTRPLHRLDVET